MPGLIKIGRSDDPRMRGRPPGRTDAPLEEPVFKIGQTKVSPVKRVEGLSSSTSVYRSFELVYFIHVSDRDQAEGHLHQALAASRVNPSKEFFLAPLMTVVRVLDQAASHWPIQLGRTPRAGFLEPALTPRVNACPHCGGRIKVPRLLVSVRVNCWSAPRYANGYDLLVV